MLLGAAAGFLKWEDSSRRDADTARNEALAAAKDSTVALLSYKPTPSRRTWAPPATG